MTWSRLAVSLCAVSSSACYDMPSNPLQAAADWCLLGFEKDCSLAMLIVYRLGCMAVCSSKTYRTSRLGVHACACLPVMQIGHRRDQYKRCANLLEAVSQLLEHFSHYQDVPKIQSLTKRLAAVQVGCPGALYLFTHAVYQYPPEPHSLVQCKLSHRLQPTNS